MLLLLRCMSVLSMLCLSMELGAIGMTKFIYLSNFRSQYILRCCLGVFILVPRWWLNRTRYWSDARLIKPGVHICVLLRSWRRLPLGVRKTLFVFTKFTYNRQLVSKTWRPGYRSPGQDLVKGKTKRIFVRLQLI